MDVNADVWHSIAAHANVDQALISAVEQTDAVWHLLLAEDWCGDAVNTLPYFGKLGELAVNVGVRVAARDQNLDIMDAHLTNGARSIPVIIVLDDDFHVP